MVKLVDTQDLKSCDHCGRAGSIPAPGTLFSFISFQIDYPKFPSWAFVVLGIPFIINILGILLPNQTIAIEITINSI